MELEPMDPKKPRQGEPYRIPFQLDLIDCIVLGDEGDRPSVTYWLSSGECHIHTFCDKEDCIVAWAIIGEELEGHGFVDGQDVFLHAGALKELKKLHTPELGHHISFVFHSVFEATWKYPDEQSLDEELTRISNVLAILQEKRATGCLPLITQ